MDGEFGDKKRYRPHEMGWALWSSQRNSACQNLTIRLMQCKSIDTSMRHTMWRISILSMFSRRQNWSVVHLIVSEKRYFANYPSSWKPLLQSECSDRILPPSVQHPNCTGVTQHVWFTQYMWLQKERSPVRDDISAPYQLSRAEACQPPNYEIL